MTVREHGNRGISIDVSEKDEMKDVTPEPLDDIQKTLEEFYENPYQIRITTHNHSCGI